MKELYLAFGLVFSGSVFGQIEHNVNKTTGTESNPISEIDSIRFNGSQTEMQIILNNGSAIIHNIEDIDNITFSGEEVQYPPGTVHCGDPTAIVDVTNPTTGKIWMDRNLGASQAATSSADADSYGDLYQWGRGADGHQCITSPTTSTLSSTDQPGHGSFILAPDSPNDWRSPQNTNLWQGENGVNNPCPSGYRLPTEAELNEERLSWTSNTAAGAFASPLRLPVAGFRLNSNGLLFNPGTSGYYWSRTISSANSRYLFFGGGGASMGAFTRARGLSVRCLKD